MKLLKALFSVVVCLAVIAQPVHAVEDIGIVNNTKIMATYPKAVEAQRRVMSIQSELQNKVQTIKDSLSKDLQAAKDDKAKAQIQQAAQSKYEAEKTKYESLLLQITKEVDDNIQAAITKVAKAKSLKVVISNNSIYYGGIDITEDVLKELK